MIKAKPTNRACTSLPNSQPISNLLVKMTKRNASQDQGFDMTSLAVFSLGTAYFTPCSMGPEALRRIPDPQYWSKG